MMNSQQPSGKVEGMRDLYTLVKDTVKEDGTLHLNPHQTKHLLRWLDSVCTMCDEQNKLLTELQSQINKAFGS